MQSQSTSGAEILPFPGRVRPSAGLRRSESATLHDLRLSRTYTPVCIDAWYHAEAVGEDQRKRDA